MAKAGARGGKGKMTWSLELTGEEVRWGREIERLARERGQSVDEAMKAALQSWLAEAGGLRDLMSQIQKASQLASRCFEVEGLLVELARSPGMSMGQQHDYIKRAEEERKQFEELRRKANRMIKEVRRIAEETGLPEAVQAAGTLKLVD